MKWTPIQLPIVIWFQENNNQIGLKQVSAVDFGELALMANVIIITVQYRLNIFGFFHNDKYSGNYGLLDQRLALEFIINNRYGLNTKLSILSKIEKKIVTEFLVMNLVETKTRLFYQAMEVEQCQLDTICYRLNQAAWLQVPSCTRVHLYLTGI